MNLTDVIIIILLSVLIGLIIARIIRNKKRGKPVCLGCSGCPSKKYCTKNKK